MQQAVRAFALLEVLQSGGTHPVSRLRERLGASERTIRRDIELLLEAGVPIEAVRGRHGGYRVTPGYRTPSLLFTDEEALTTVVGLLLAGEAGLLSDADGAAASAAAKLRRALPAALRRRVDAVLGSVTATGAGREPTPAATRTVLDLADAVRERRAVQLAYARADGVRVDRLVHPYGVVAHDAHWYLVAGVEGVAEPRVFRVDRILRHRLRRAVFRGPAEFDIRGFLLASLASVPRAHVVRVRVDAGLDAVLRRFPPGAATVETADDGWLRIELRAERLDWVAAAIAGLDRPFVIEQPDELRDEVRALAARLVSSLADRSVSRLKPEV
ncbi:helix-turn-helix transcriptional regulator [Protaetiibacter intestinalis]|uniref:WYL domain-containing protein n=1 Tax=Protaetiibacter intestinalis TaxID=2419774 RepID=A0A387B7P3_9MICO|nr:WYL domain-containing protein [Protaetiibacter intestinalis]AYF97768.1 WYL domain-containing protein [Protaetiibacter intestinalis]